MVLYRVSFGMIHTRVHASRGYCFVRRPPLTLQSIGVRHCIQREAKQHSAFMLGASRVTPAVLDRSSP